MKRAIQSSPGRGTDSAEPREAWSFLLDGYVQGLGVRPAVYRLAEDCALAGVIRNTAKGVEVHLEGDSRALAEFQQRLQFELPAAARPSRIDHQKVAVRGCVGIRIECCSESSCLATPVPPDLATCADCLAEIVDPANRRFRYPFTSCTNCGPRYTIIRAMPYERADTSMVAFPMCPACRAEYADPRNRRFHAQTNACPDCGPRVWCTLNPEIRGNGDPAPLWDADAIARAVNALRQGQVLAIRGLGGYQLLVDATRDDAVQELRRRKHRPAKPLAVMVASLEQARSLAWLEEMELATLADSSNPIVLLRTKDESPLAAGIHPGLNVVGLMLPTTPLHALLALDFGRPLVCTSGNREGDPLEYDLEAAQHRLADLCDVWLHHDRPIERPIDDSVVRVMAGTRVVLRLARGLAPLPLAVDREPPRTAVGGFLKASLAWSNGQQAVLGPHLGDLQTTAARKRFADHLQDMQRLYGVQAQKIVHDAHPDYPTTQWAQAQPVPQQAVQHHYAHILAAMVEHHLLDRTVLGVSWDGTGFGSDGTIWGGEFLICQAGQWSRVGNLRPFRLPGGEAAVLQPWRTAVELTIQATQTVKTVATDRFLDALRVASPIGSDRLDPILLLVDRPHLAPLTTSAGRLFDAASAMILRTHVAQFDGQPAMLLESAVDPSEMGAYPLPLCDSTDGTDTAIDQSSLTGGASIEGLRASSLWLDWRPLVRAILEDSAAHVAAGVMAMRFHRGVAQGIWQVCHRFPDLPVVLGGGVFQNRVLLELLAELVPRQRLFLPGTIPPNDGGLAAGQLAAAGHRIPEPAEGPAAICIT